MGRHRNQKITGGKMLDTGKLSSKPFMFLALSTRGDVSMLVNIKAIGERYAVLPDQAWLCDTVGITFKGMDPEVTADNESVSGYAIIGGEAVKVHIPWDAVRHMISPDDGLWMGWSDGRVSVERPKRPVLEVIDGDGSSATDSPDRHHLVVVE